MDKHKAVIEKIKATMKEWEEKRRAAGLPVSNEGTRTYWNAHKKHDRVWRKQCQHGTKAKKDAVNAEK